MMVTKMVLVPVGRVRRGGRRPSPKEPRRGEHGIVNGMGTNGAAIASACVSSVNFQRFNVRVLHARYGSDGNQIEPKCSKLQTDSVAAGPLPRLEAAFLTRPPVHARGKSIRCNAGAGLSVSLSSPLFLPLGLLAAGVAGIFAPGIGQSFAALPASRIVPTVGIFLISGMNTRAKDTSSLSREWRALLLAILLTLVITPLLGAVMCVCGCSCLRLRWDVVFGYAVLVCAPTTLSSCVGLATQLSSRAGAAALLLTVTTNAAAVVSMPFFVSALVARLLGVYGIIGSGGAGDAAAAYHINASPMVAELVKTVMVPFFVGCALRRTSPAIARAVDANRPLISAVSNLLLILVPWMQVSKGHLTMRGAGAGTLLSTAAIGLALHLTFLATAFAASEAFRISDDVSIRRTVAIVGSQKTLPVSVAVLQQLEHLAVSVPIAMLPLLVAHFIQIVVDSFVVAIWKRDARDAGDET